MHLYLEAGRGGINAQWQQVRCADDQVFTPALGGGGSAKRESHHLSRRMAVQSVSSVCHENPGVQAASMCCVPCRFLCLDRDVYATMRPRTHACPSAWRIHLHWQQPVSPSMRPHLCPPCLAMLHARCRVCRDRSCHHRAQHDGTSCMLDASLTRCEWMTCPRRSGDEECSFHGSDPCVATLMQARANQPHLNRVH